MNSSLAASCQTCQDALPDLLLDPSSPAAAVARQHLEACAACRSEFSGIEAAFHAMDAWIAPEPSPWFDSRLAARLREEQAMAPEGFLSRLRSRLLFSSGVHFRPALVGALALLLAVSGGTAVEVSHLLHPATIEASATVQDLQILDRNDQALQTMDQLLGDDNQTATPDDGNAASAPTS